MNKTWMDLKIIIFNTEWSKSDRERQISYDIIYMHNLKKIMQVKLLTKQKQTHRQRMNLQLLGEKAWWGIDWEFGNNMYTLLYLK